MTAQNQAGSVAIAGAIVPASSSITGGFVGCVEKLVAIGTPNKEARHDCLKVSGKAAKLGSDVSDDASGAAEAGRPVIISGYGGRYGSSYGYSYPRERVIYQASTSRPVAEARPAAAPRPAAQPRLAAKPRPAASPRPIRNR